MSEQLPNAPALSASQPLKRNVAYKIRIGMLLAGKPLMENERLKSVDIDGKHVVRANIVANIIDKYIQEGERKFGTLTLDDATGQLKLKAFGDDVEKFASFIQGDTVAVIGLVRFWNSELYLTPEIIRKKDPAYLLIRKLEIEASMPKTLPTSDRATLKDKLLAMVKEAEKDNGIEIERIILELKEHPEVINQEIARLLKDGNIYEPRPGKLRWLG